MVTYRRPEYTRLSLARLLAVADEDTRVWLWHNGGDEATLDVVRSHLGHPRVHRFHHSVDNAPLRDATNWLWRESAGWLLGKVDDDCLVAPEWVPSFREAHGRAPRLGVLSSWHFQPSDFDLELARSKLRMVDGVQILENLWVAGSGYLMKRACMEDGGPLEHTWAKWCMRQGSRGWRNGYLYPLVYQDHLDDPRSPHTGIRTDADLIDSKPLSAVATGALTVDAWTEMLRADARVVLTASTDPAEYQGLRQVVRRIRTRLANRRKPIA